jgi:hypothetical protein
LKLFRLLPVVLILAQAALWNVQQADAQSQNGIELENVVALVNFGEQITFVATVKSPLPIQNASILILNESQGTTQVEPLTVQTDGRTEFQYDIQQNSVRPFGKLSWSYRFILPDGSTTNSEVYSTHYDDNRYDWQTVESGMLHIHWYGGNADFGQALLSTAQAGLDSVKRLIPADLAQPVDFYVYASLNDLRDTLVPGSQDWIAGHADPSLGVVMVAIEPGPAQENTMLQRLPHELMHIMLYRALGNSYASIPTWLNEGTASLTELIANTTYDSSLQSAISRNDWIPISSLCVSFPTETDRAFLAYAESRSFTEYIYKTYGSSGLFNLATAYAKGAGCEDGPATAFGEPLGSLEQNWLATVAGKKAPSPPLQNIVPYLVLLFLVLFVPLIGIAVTTWNKESRNGSKTELRK